MEDNGLNPSSEEKKDPMEKSDAQPKKPFVPGWYFVFGSKREFGISNLVSELNLRTDFPDADYYASSAASSYAFYKAPALTEVEIDVLSERNSNQTLLGSATLTYLVCEAHLREMERVGNQNAKKPGAGKKDHNHVCDESCLPLSMPSNLKRAILPIINDRQKSGEQRGDDIFRAFFGSL